MNNPVYDVLIIGGGPAGLSCAQTLASAARLPKNPVRVSVLIVDAGKSHLSEAALYQAPGLPLGISGAEILRTMRENIRQLGGVEWAEDTIVAISGSAESGFTATGQNHSYSASRLVIATGTFDPGIRGLPPLTSNPLGHKPPMVMLPNQNGLVAPGLYVAGLFAGEPSMFAIAAGSGCRTGILLYREFLGQTGIIHHTPADRV